MFYHVVDVLLTVIFLSFRWVSSSLFSWNERCFIPYGDVDDDDDDDDTLKVVVPVNVT
jgi:hypothetical protein